MNKYPQQYNQYGKSPRNNQHYHAPQMIPNQRSFPNSILKKLEELKLRIEKKNQKKENLKRKRKKKFYIEVNKKGKNFFFFF